MNYRNPISTLCIALLATLAYFNVWLKFLVVLPSCVVLLAICWLPARHLERIVDFVFAIHAVFKEWQRRRAREKITPLLQSARAECAVACVAPFRMRGRHDESHGATTFCAYNVTDAYNCCVDQGSLSFSRMKDALEGADIGGELKAIHISLRPPFKDYSILMQEETIEITIGSHTPFEVQ